MEFGRAFTFAFEDPDWLKKVGIAALVVLIPLIGPIILMGWGLEITRRVINNDPEPLPGWDDFSSFVSKGFQAFVVSLAYSLPVILILSCGYAVFFGVIFAAGEGNPEAAGGIATLIMSCVICLVFLLAILTGFLTQAALGTLAATGELGAAFRIGDIFGLLRAAPGPYLMVLLGAMLANIVLAPLGSLICGIGLLFTSAYTAALSSHLSGQAYLAAKSAHRIS